MFFRTKKTKTGSAIQLVHNYRDNRNKVRQKIIVSLGNMPVPKALRKEIASEIEARLDGQESLLPVSAGIGKWVDVILDKINEEKRWTARIDTSHISDDEEVADGVLIDRIEHENETQLGPVLVLQSAWEALGLGNCLEAAGFSHKQIKAAMVSIFNRLIEPVSEYELRRWVATMSFNELLEDNIKLYGKDMYYRVSDALLSKSKKIEKHLRRRETTLFNLERTVILYDLTNTHFEGQCAKIPRAKRGKSKQKRSDCPLLSLGLTVDKNGFLLSHRIFEGNRHDAKTLVEMVNELEKIISEEFADNRKTAVVVDSGIATEDNLKYLRSKGYDYIVAGKRQSRSSYYEDFGDFDSFSIVPGREKKSPVYVSRKEEDGELKVLCRSKQRKSKEDAILSKAEERYLYELKHINERLANPRSPLEEQEDVERAIGRAASKYSRASKFYTVTFEPDDKRIQWYRNDDKFTESRKLNGCYLLRSSILEMTEQQVWQCYSSLTKVEHAFEMMKTHLGLRPIRHYTEERCEAHIFITVLAYHLMCWVECKMKTGGAPTTWWNLRRLLQTHCYSTTVVPSKDGKIRCIRKAGRPDERQRTIYQILDADYKKLPKRKRTFLQK